MTLIPLLDKMSASVRAALVILALSFLYYPSALAQQTGGQVYDPEVASSSKAKQGRVPRRVLRKLSLAMHRRYDCIATRIHARRETPTAASSSSLAWTTYCASGEVYYCTNRPIKCEPITATQANVPTPTRSYVKIPSNLVGLHLAKCARDIDVLVFLRPNGSFEVEGTSPAVAAPVRSCLERVAQKLYVYPVEKSGRAMISDIGSSLPPLDRLKKTPASSVGRHLSQCVSGVQVTLYVYPTGLVEFGSASPEISETQRECVEAWLAGIRLHPVPGMGRATINID